MFVWKLVEVDIENQIHNLFLNLCVQEKISVSSCIQTSVIFIEAEITSHKKGNLKCFNLYMWKVSQQMIDRFLSNRKKA